MSMKKSPRWRAEDAQHEEQWRQTDSQHRHHQQYQQQQESFHWCSECSISAASLNQYNYIGLHRLATWCRVTCFQNWLGYNLQFTANLSHIRLVGDLDNVDTADHKIIMQIFGGRIGTQTVIWPTLFRHLSWSLCVWREHIELVAISRIGFPPTVLFIQQRGSGFCGVNPEDPGVGVCLPAKWIENHRFQWLYRVSICFCNV